VPCMDEMVDIIDHANAMKINKELIMLQGVHFLLTYMCNFECDHCLVYSGPKAPGTFTLSQIKDVIDEMTKIDTAEWVYFEGGEPFLYYQ
jgi:MoaA/NifB/PqqE/SkfB family radical SAM enzyme